MNGSKGRHGKPHFPKTGFWDQPVSKKFSTRDFKMSFFDPEHFCRGVQPFGHPRNSLRFTWFGYPYGLTPPFSMEKVPNSCKNHVFFGFRHQRVLIS